MPETEPVPTNEQHDLINEWVFDMCEEYDLPLTNNEPRVQNGVQLRHVGEFTGDLMDLVKGIKAAARREALLEAADAYSDVVVFVDTDGHRSMALHGLTTPEWLRKHAAALAEPERDEESGRCTELTCPQHGPANRAKREGA